MHDFVAIIGLNLYAVPEEIRSYKTTQHGDNQNNQLKPLLDINALLKQEFYAKLRDVVLISYEHFQKS